MSEKQNTKILIGRKLDELDAYYKNINLPTCTSCNTKDDVIPCVFGRPSSDLLTYASMGRVKLMGCCVSSKEPDGFCKKCNKEV
jgi:hypothetical protein